MYGHNTSGKRNISMFMCRANRKSKVFKGRLTSVFC